MDSFFCGLRPSGRKFSERFDMAVAGLIVGLGNPGKQYESTRHNMGFLFVDELLREAKNVSSMSGDKFRCELWKAALPGSPDQWLIAKPQTFMNLSGECVQPLAAWHRLLPENILVVHDELDIAGPDEIQEGRGQCRAQRFEVDHAASRHAGFLPPSPRHRPFPAWRRGHRELGSRAAQSRGAGRLPQTASRRSGGCPSFC